MLFNCLLILSVAEKPKVSGIFILVRGFASFCLNFQIYLLYSCNVKTLPLVFLGLWRTLLICIFKYQYLTQETVVKLSPVVISTAP